MVRANERPRFPARSGRAIVASTARCPAPPSSPEFGARTSPLLLSILSSGSSPCLQRFAREASEASEAMALMASSGAGAAEGGDGRKAGELNGAKILLVEDEFLIALDLQILLYRLGCDVLGPVGSVAESLVLLRHERPDAAVLDINLRDGIVTPVVERLDAMKVPFVLVTARDTSMLNHPRLLGIPALSKPVEERALRQGIESLLRDA